VYVPFAVIWVFAWKLLTRDLYLDRWLFVEKVGLAVQGYGICFLAFLLASAIQFVMCIISRRRCPLDWDRGLKVSLVWMGASFILLIIFALLIPRSK